MQRKLTILMLALLPIASAWAADSVKIANDSSGLPPDLVQNLAHTSKSMGVKEPMNVSVRSEGGARYAVVSGTSGTTCRIKLSNGNPPTILGLSCR
ncbi:MULTISPECIES: hypothetical protein [Eikenella]|uniref:Uncharacterized protein n=1 Tax=Eikenella longinqua TaxID=1795827 RepID=A0A1A9RV10_9NEIS|nr:MULTISPECIES: hypothetical protein [Eikenella]OAM26889.1 hypothetical protein A7P95_09065 [Eikenella longinqua]